MFVILTENELLLKMILKAFIHESITTMRSLLSGIRRFPDPISSLSTEWIEQGTPQT